MQDMSWQKFIGKSRSLARDGMVWFFFFRAKRIWAPILFNCLWLVSWLQLYWRQFGGNMASTRNSPSAASIKVSTSSASVNQNAKYHPEKRISSSVAICARIFPPPFRVSWLGDWHMNQLVLFWRDRRQKLERAKILCSRKIRKY